jgi:hypothetical protein
MALTTLQRDVCRLLADSRIASGESGDLDLFHDTEEALAATWDSDRRLLEAGGYALRVLRERPACSGPETPRTRAIRRPSVTTSRPGGLRFTPAESGELSPPFVARKRSFPWTSSTS